MKITKKEILNEVFYEEEPYKSYTLKGLTEIGNNLIQKGLTKDETFKVIGDITSIIREEYGD